MNTGGKMAGSTILALAAVWLLCGGDPARGEKPGVTASGRKNLIKNGDFEKGSGGKPAGWQEPDGLTSFWVRDSGRRGKCIKINTDVRNSQFRAREDAMEKARSEKRRPPPPPRRLPTSSNKYETVGGNDGVHFGADPIPIQPGTHFLLEADVRVEGKASPKIWVKCYGTFKSRNLTRERVLWKKSLNCEGANREWKTFRMVFPRNTTIPSRVSKLRLYLYPYWPAAVYYFDNVKLVEITEEEVKEFSREHDLLEKSPAK